VVAPPCDHPVTSSGVGCRGGGAGGAVLDLSAYPDLLPDGPTEMHRRVSGTDWAATPVGPVEEWSPTLRSAAVLCLASRVPMALVTAPDLVMLYNDAFRALLGGRHPVALGARWDEVWADVWPVIGPLTERSLAGESVFFEDLPLVMTRNGFEEEAWFTFSYSPVRDPDGRVVAVLDTALETTRRVLTARRLELLRRLGALPRSVSGSAAGACAAALEVVAEHAQDCPLAVAYVLRRDGVSLRPVTASGTRVRGEAVAELERAVREAIATRAPVMLTGLVDRWPTLFRRPAGPLGEVDVDTAVVLPMTEAGQKRPLGAFVVGPSPRAALDDEHRGFLELLAAQVAAAVNDARAIKQQRERADERTAVERAQSRFLTEVAITLQRAVLGPTALPPGFAVHYEPATRSLEVGGDWYDVVDLADGRYGVVVGDVVGRGLDAAAIMGQLRSAARALLLESRSHGQVLSALDAFAGRIPGASCTTVFCAVVEPCSGVLRYSSAGHLPAVLADGGPPQLLDGARGLPLAVADGYQRTEAEAVLPSGGTLLLYTDGLVERRREVLDEGVARAVAALDEAQHLPPDELADALRDALLPGPRDDDVAFLVYQRG
jgi:serine phosphatase RsbU (regulator of sigma subunit)